MIKMRILLLLLIVSCKPAIRQTSDLQAITDGKLMLGTVAATTRQGDHQVYRLLVCKNNVATDDASVFNDDNSCRPALVNQQHKEIILLPNHLRRGFAEKYKGRFKRATIGTLVALPFLIAIPIAKVAGRPAYKYVKNTIKKGDIGIASKLVDSELGLASKGNKFYRELHDLQNKELNRFASSIEGKRLSTDEMYGVADIIKLHEGTYLSIDQLTMISKLEDQREVLLDLKKTGQQFTGSPVSEQEVKFLEQFNDQKLHLEESFSKVDEFRTGKKNVYTQKNMVNSLERLPNKSKQLIYDMPRYYELYVKELIGNTKTTDQAINAIDKQLARNKNAYNAFAEGRDEIAQRMLDKNKKEILDELFDFNWLAFGVGLAAGSAVILSLEESIWGHGDRQASRYWSKIFHDSYHLDRAMTVKDLPKIIHSLAKTFHCQVNDKALQLANY